MAKERLELHEELVNLLGARNVYFQPPESIKMKYPCIVYKRTNIETRYADNIAYKKMNQYIIEPIERDPDSTLVDRILDYFPYCHYERGFVYDNLYHNILILYF